MNIIDIVEFLYQYRMHLALAVILAWVVYAAFHIKKFKPKFLRKPKPKPVAEAPEVKLTQIKSEAEKLRKENERLSLALSLYKKEAMEQEIKRLAQQKLQALIPDELMLLDPLNNPAGRPIYQIGAVPVINKEEELQRLTEQHPLSKILPDKLIKKLLDFIMFRGDTLYFYTAELLPNGKWAIVATSKPPKKKGNRIKPSLFSRPYLLFTSQQPKLDDLIVNKWEVTRAKAAILLSSSFMGPFPAEQLGKIYSQIGWFSGREIAK